MIQFALLGLTGLAGALGPAWAGQARLVVGGVGLVLMATGTALGGWGLLDLRSALTPLPYPRAGAELIETGAFRLARHPIYGGIVIGATGYGLATASPVALVGAAVLLGFFRLKSAREEIWLLARYPGYRTYRDRTRRLLPFVY